MKIIVAHTSPDWDAITSVWLLKKFAPGWEDAAVEFVPAGQNIRGNTPIGVDPIEKLGQDEVIHVDTGLGPLDHHQTFDMSICAASLTFDYVKNLPQSPLTAKNDKGKTREEAVERIIRFVVALDHFQEVFWLEAASDTYEFGFFGILEGFKAQHPNDDSGYVVFGMILLDAMVHRMEERIWAEAELQKGKEFETRFGKGIAVETLNDETMKLGQKMGYAIMIRKDPRKGYVRIKARPNKADVPNEVRDPHGNPASNSVRNDNIDLTLTYEQLKKMDPKATWFLHVSKKMLLNGTPKNPTMVPSTLTLDQIVKVIEKI